MVEPHYWMLSQATSKMFILVTMFLLSACTTGSLAQPPQVTSAPSTPATSQPQNNPTPTTGPLLAQTPQALACSTPMPLTDALTEGPYFKAGSPERTSLLESGMSGKKLVLSGYVLTQDCKPIVGALLDFWQADASGQYDNSGYTLRGHQYTDAQGYYRLETIVPGLYPGRTEHIHVKVQAPNGPILTTQLFFPGVTGNDQDSIYDPKMQITIQDTSDGELGMFNFVLNAP